MTNGRFLLAAMMAIAAAPAALAQSAVPKAVATLNTFGDISEIDGRWIWANTTSMIDLNAPDGDKITEKMVQFCPEDRSPVMAIASVEGGFNIGVIDAPEGLHWQYRHDQTGAYELSIDPDIFYTALGYSDERPPSDSIRETNERNSGRVMVIRPDADVLLITHRNGYDIYVRCDDKS